MCSFSRAKGTHLVFDYLGGDGIILKGTFCCFCKNIPIVPCLISMITNCIISARKTDIIRVTEQILDAISSGDFEGYTYVSSLTLLYLDI